MTSARPLRPRGAYRERSSVPSGGATAASVRLSRRPAGGARSRRSCNSITCRPTRGRVPPPSTTSRFAAGHTTSTRRSWSSGLADIDRARQEHASLL